MRKCPNPPYIQAIIKVLATSRVISLIQSIKIEIITDILWQNSSYFHDSDHFSRLGIVVYFPEWWPSLRPSQPTMNLVLAWAVNIENQNRWRLTLTIKSEIFFHLKKIIFKWFQRINKIGTKMIKKDCQVVILKVNMLFLIIDGRAQFRKAFLQAKYHKQAGRQSHSYRHHLLLCLQSININWALMWHSPS